MENTIKKQFEEVIKWSQDYYHFDVDAGPLFEKWHEAKKEFIEAFGGLIYEYPEPVSFDLPKDAKEDKFLNFVRNCDFNLKLQQFLMKEKDNFYDNIVREDHENVPKGMKISRALKFFIDDKEMLDRTQTYMSTILQEVRVSGTLCFSVHPLDFLSASENTYNWRSCHALDGEYRSGNLSYMVDSSTIICYLKSDKEVILPRFPSSVPWNNKKWRMFLFLSNKRNLVFAGRQYPFFNEDILSLIQRVIKKDLKLLKPQGLYYSDWTPFRQDVITKCGEVSLDDKYIEIRRKMYPMRNIVEDMDGSLHFNDLLYSSGFIPYYFNEESYAIEMPSYKVSVGGGAPCLKCGNNDVWLSSTMLCKDCELEYGNCTDEDYFSFCEYCGERVYNDDVVYVDDMTFCSHCADRVAEECPSCGALYLSDNGVYLPSKEITVCENCWWELKHGE